MAAKAFASLLLLPIAKAIKQDACAAAVQAPLDSWQPAFTYSAVLAGKAEVIVPPRALGFNRTVLLENMCTPAYFPSNQFTYVNASTEFIAKASAAAAGIGMEFAGATCKLSGIALSKTPEVQLRLQFENCTGGPAGLAMALVMGVSSDATGTSTSELLPWVNEILKTAAPPTVSTTEKPVNQISMSSHEVTYAVGPGKCNAETSVTLSNIPVKGTCQMRCSSMSKQHAISASISDECSGYAYNPSTKDCIIYKTPITTSTHEDKWACINITMVSDDEMSVIPDTTTPAPTAAPPTVSNIDLRQILQISPITAVTQISPPVADPTCFNPVWWFQLEDRAGNPTAIPLLAADYADLLQLLPQATAPKGNVSAPRVLDRAIVDSCFQNEWGGTLCQVTNKRVANPVCTSDAMGNAMITGVATALGTWIIVGLVFFILSQSIRQKSQDGFTQPTEQMGDKTVCSAQTALFLSLVAICGAVATSFGSMQLVNEMLRSQLCYDVDEALVIMLTAMLSAGLAIVIILQYIKRQHPKHPHPIFTQAPAAPPAPPQTLVMMEVPDHVQPGQRMDGGAMSSLSPSMNGSINGSYQSQR
jgi:hypothetical protein